MGMVNGTREERRSRQRYPLRLPLSCKILRRRQGRILGETIDISSKGVLFAAAEPLPIRAGIEILIDWPVVGPHGEVLKLELFARTTRCDRDLVAAEIRSHRLLTLRPREGQPNKELQECALR
jgi:hypothetical protein